MKPVRHICWMVALTVWLLPSATRAQDTTVTLRGKLVGGNSLLNPVWAEAADGKNHRYGFREGSATVSAKAKRLAAYLPKELCIVAFSSANASTNKQPLPIYISGGRTTPVTIVIPPDHNVQFINVDPFPHRLFDVKKVQGGLGAEDTGPTKQRIWKPPTVGKYEIRDAYFPSVRSWIVVAPNASAFGFPTIKDPTEYTVSGVSPGEYELRGYFNGEPVGKALKVNVTGSGEEETIREPLVVGETKSKEK